MDLAETVAILIARVLPATVADRLVPIAPGWQTGVDVVLIGVDTGALGHDGLDDRLDRLLLHLGRHAQHHLPAALDQAEDRWLVLLQRAALDGGSGIGRPTRPRHLRAARRLPRGAGALAPAQDAPRGS